jgi:hypothetical protein
MGKKSLQTESKPLTEPVEIRLFGELRLFFNEKEEPLSTNQPGILLACLACHGEVCAGNEYYWKIKKRDFKTVVWDGTLLVEDSTIRTAMSAARKELWEKVRKCSNQNYSNGGEKFFSLTSGDNEDISWVYLRPLFRSSVHDFLNYFARGEFAEAVKVYDETCNQQEFLAGYEARKGWGWVKTVREDLRSKYETARAALAGKPGETAASSDLPQGTSRANESPGVFSESTSTIQPVIPRAVELNYLRWLQATLWDVDCYTPLKGGVQSKPRVEMEQMFRHWRRTDAAPPEEKEFADAVPVMRRLQRVILLGDPGGGKTTTLARLAADLATEALGDEQAPLPLFIRLGYWVSAEQALPDFIAEHLSAMVEREETNCDLGAHFATLLTQKRAALLLDGLNEFPPDQRQKKYAEVREFISAQARQNKKLLTVASCRELDYEEAGMKFDRILITPLDPVRIRDFVRRYLGDERSEALFWKLVGEKTRVFHADFLAKVGAQHEESFWRDNELPAGTHWPNFWQSDDGDGRWRDWLEHRANPGSLIKLARNPLMLSMMTQVFEKHGDLPGNQGDLFRDFVNQLLDRERERELISDEEQRQLLAGLTCIAHTMQMRADDEGNATTILSRAETVSTFTALYHPRTDKALGERLLRLAHSASLLSLGDPVRFTHQLLQEYFAACWLDAKLRADKLPAAQLWKPGNWWERNNWEEAAILLAGLYSDDCTPVVKWLADAQPEIAAQCLTRSGASIRFVAMFEISNLT